MDQDRPSRSRGNEVGSSLTDDEGLLVEIRWVAREARELMSAATDPDRIAAFEKRKRALLAVVHGRLPR